MTRNTWDDDETNVVEDEELFTDKQYDVIFFVFMSFIRILIIIPTLFGSLIGLTLAFVFSWGVAPWDRLHYWVSPPVLAVYGFYLFCEYRYGVWTNKRFSDNAGYRLSGS